MAKKKEMAEKTELSPVEPEPVIMQPIVITKPTYDVENLWISVFGDTIVVNYPDETKLKTIWEEFGRVVGQAKAVKIQYETAGLKESSKKLDQELKKQEDELERRTLEIIGYPKLNDFVMQNLEAEAKKINMYLNRYAIDKYPHLPPPQCVDAMQKAKPFFNQFEVWAIEDKQVTFSQASDQAKKERAFKDPVIIGINNRLAAPGVTTAATSSSSTTPPPVDRYFIASWGDDIPLDQVLSNANRQLN